MQYTKEQRTAANRTDLYDFLLRTHPEQFKKEGQKYIRFKNDNSIIIGRGFSGYKDCATDEAGNNIDFLMKYLNYGLVEAILALSGEQFSSPDVSKSHTEPKMDPEKAKIVIPDPVAGSYRQLYAYLLYRKIEKDTIQMLLDQKLIYQEAAHNNIVFINRSRDWGEVHGTLSYKSHHGILENSKPGGFWFFQVGNMEKSKNVFICEAAIDAISLYEIRRIRGELSDDVYVSIGGASKQAAIDYLKTHYKPILAVDNDEAGQNARDRNKDLKSLIPDAKDWNDDLQKIKTPE